MLDEWEEFRAYTEPPVYASSGKTDNAFLGRFTFDMLKDFEGLARVLTILVRGFMFGAGNTPDVHRARHALLAWCSVPDGKVKTADWQYRTAHPELNGAFPELVDEDGIGWLCRHVRDLCRYAKEHPDTVGKRARDNCAVLSSGFERAWHGKVVQIQIPLFDPNTRGAWVLRFDDILADAAELGPLKNRDFVLSEEASDLLRERLPEIIPFHVAEILVRYYAANRQDGTEWVVLPVTNFDAYFGDTNFSRKWLGKIPESILIRESQSGVCRYRVAHDLTTELTDEKA